MQQASPGKAKTDVVFTYAHEMFDDTVNREFCRPADQALLALASDERVGELLIADAWRSYGVSIARRRPVRLSAQVTIGGREAVRVRPHRLRRSDAVNVDSVIRSYRRYGDLLGTALARKRGEPRLQADSAVLFTHNPFVAAYCDSPWISKIIYFGEDDYVTGEGVAKWWTAFGDAYDRIDQRAADVFVVSEELAGRVSSRAKVVPNGVIAEVWRQHLPVPQRIAVLPRPMAVYTGTLSDRLERSLVEKTAKTVGSLVMIGYPGDYPTMEWLNSLDNVHVFGPVGQRELSATVAACDVGIIPHRDQACFRAMSPLKLYEYLAAGLPVVSVDFPPIRGVDDSRVHICADRADWEDCLARALQSGPAPEGERNHFIDQVAWEQRMRTVVDAVTA